MKNVLLYFLLLPVLGFSQFEDDFSDGNLSENPQWYGTTDRFRVNEDYQLQLNDDEEGSAYLATSNQRLDSTEWHFSIELGFSPSSNNHARVYLATDQGNPGVMNASYYLQFGESGSDDAITLYQSYLDEQTLICRGTEGLISSSFSMDVKVTRNSSGIWKIFVDPLNSGFFELEASGSSTLVLNPEYFSIQCNYTVSNSDDFIFDNIVVKPLEKDLAPPIAEKAQPSSENTLVVHFNEAIDASTAENVSNYSLSEGFGEPESATVDSEIPNIVTLLFSNDFENHQTYTLTISNVEDLSGNSMNLSQLSFEYLKPYSPGVYQVVINEIMADVNPEPNELPAYDYVELYNRSENMMDLSGARLTFGSHQKLLPPDTYIQPHSYLILTDDNSQLEAEHISYFTTFPVNTQTRMTLSDMSGKLIHTVDYKKEWYDDETKENGGWSLEIIDPENPCGCDENWTASLDVKGGTPGATNSANATNPDNSPPKISYIEILNDSSLRVLFSESMDSTSLSQTSYYWLDESTLHPDELLLKYPDYKSVTLSFSPNTFTEDHIFTLHISPEASDCSGNHLETPYHSFANYEPVYGDLIIQEIMADVNPEPRELPPVEYMEIYNRSSYPIDLADLMIKLGDKRIVFEKGRAINAEGYLVVAENYPGLNANNELLLVPNLGITNGHDQITILSKKGRIIHFAEFEKSWYDDEIKAEGGWSLEMIDNDNYCSGNDNWTASIDAAGGTPGLENSVKTVNEDLTPPDLLRLGIINTHTIRLYFTERMDSTTIIHPEYYNIAPNPGQIVLTDPVEPSFEAVELTFDNPVQSDIVYAITASNALKDCMGNGLLVSKPLEFSYPVLPDTGDLVINEILFNPKNDGVDFLELYNVSSHAIDISSLYVKLLDPVSGEIKKETALASEKLIFIQNNYLVLTESPEILISQYPKAQGQNLLQVEDLPDFPNQSGRVVMADIQNKTLDDITYSDDMHFPLLNNTEGVSLERVDASKSSSDTDNWHSASETENFATPGYRNSQNAGKTGKSSELSISPKIITPNNDGNNDQLLIDYQFDKAGYSANMFVYDAKGREMIRLCSNKQLGTSGRLFWDGMDADKKLVQTGYYILYIEVFDMKGNLHHYKKTFVVAGI